MPNVLLDRAKAAVGLTLKSGADAAWALATSSRSTSCEVRNGSLEKMQESNSRGLALHIFVKGRYFTHNTSDLREGQLESFIQEAVALTGALQPDPFRKLPDPKLYEGGSNVDLQAVDASLASLTPEQRIDRCLELDTRIAGKKGVISASSSMNDGRWEGAGVSSNGFEEKFTATWVGQYGSVTLRGEGDRRPEGGMGANTRHMSDLPEISWIGDEALRRARERLGSKKGPTMDATLVVDRQSAGRLIGAMLGAASGSALQQGRSFLAKSQGKRVFGEKFSLHDDPLIPRASNSRPFDFEGIAAKRFALVEQGVLRNFYIDTYYGRKLDMAPTTAQPSNLVVTPGKGSLNDLVGGVDKGVYVTSWLGGNSDSTSGEFSLGLRGLLIENGKLGGPVGEMNITGKLTDLFSNLSAVGDDVWKYGMVRSPTLVFDNVSFSGA